MPLSLQIAICAYHTTRCLEPGSVIFEAKDRAYDPVWDGGGFGGGDFE